MTRAGSHLFVYSRRTSLGLTVWRRGAVTVQFRGRMLSVVLGDWWRAHPEAPASSGGFGQRRRVAVDRVRQMMRDR